MKSQNKTWMEKLATKFKSNIKAIFYFFILYFEMKYLLHCNVEWLKNLVSYKLSAKNISFLC